MALQCCDFSAPLIVGDTVATITIQAGSPDTVSGITIFAEGCDGVGSGCGYTDNYEVPPESGYCDVTQGGTTPNATITNVEYTITSIPAEHTLVIDAVDRTVRLVQTGAEFNQVGGLDAMEWRGLFDWIEATKGGCMKVCVDDDGATTNADTVVKVTTTDREK